MNNINNIIEKFYKSQYNYYLNLLIKSGVSYADAQDIIQNSLIKIIKNFNGNSKTFIPYFTKTLKSETINFSKKNKKYCEIKIDAEEKTNVEEEIILKEEISNLSVIEKMKYEGYTNKEISLKLNISVNNVKYKLRKSKWEKD